MKTYGKFSVHCDWYYIFQHLYEYNRDVLSVSVHHLAQMSLNWDRIVLPSGASHPRDGSAGLLQVSLVTLSTPNHLCGLASVPVAAVLAAA